MSNTALGGAVTLISSWYRRFMFSKANAITEINFTSTERAKCLKHVCVMELLRKPRYVCQLNYDHLIFTGILCFSYS